MRMPLSKIYRAFPELDQFSDAECVRYLAHVQARERWQLRCLVQRLVFAFGVVTYVACVAAVIRPVLQNSPPPFVLVMIVVAMCMAVGAPVLLIRDLLIRRSIARHLNSTCCPKCGYSLLGLPVTSGATACPECGAKIVLAEHSLTEDDLLVRRDAPSNGPEESN